MNKARKFLDNDAKGKTQLIIGGYLEKQRIFHLKFVYWTWKFVPYDR